MSKEKQYKPTTEFVNNRKVLAEDNFGYYVELTEDERINILYRDFPEEAPYFLNCSSPSYKYISKSEVSKDD